MVTNHPLPDSTSQALIAFGFNGAEVRRFGAGHINDSLRVDVRDPARAGSYLLQRISPAFADPAGLMANIVAVTDYLKQVIQAAGGDPERETLSVVPTVAGETFYRTTEGEAWRAFSFIEGTTCYQTAESPAVFRQAGAAFGLFARRLEAYPAADLNETLPHFHDTPVRYRNFEQAVTDDVMGRANSCAPEIEFVRTRAAQCGHLTDQLAAGRLPLRVTHNDTKLNNVLFDPARDRSCVIDLDTVMPGLTAYDFGDAIRYGANTASEDENNLDLVTFSLPLFQAYAEGFLSQVGDSLTSAERASLPWGARLMTLECGMRFLTDHLQGDTYYRIARPGHNLDRARNQFALLADMETQVDAMDEVIARL